MARFSAGGREWDMRLTHGALADLRKAGFDLKAASASGEWLAEIVFGDEDRLANIFWELLRTQAEAAGVDRDAFDHLLDFQTLDAAGQALTEEVIDFFHRGRQAHIRKHLPAVLERMQAAAGRAVEAAAGQAVSTLNSGAGNSAASSASTPGP